MNIKQSKKKLSHRKSLPCKDALGEYAIQPSGSVILLMGPPGIGKTQVMEQSSRECGVALVAYTITHHTRQSAVGLPFIRQRNYGGKDVSVTEYTMSEIIASIYAKNGGHRPLRGHSVHRRDQLCVGNAGPTMLQFLYVRPLAIRPCGLGDCGGKPTEYNKSVRDFDIVTLDRVRRMDIEPDLPCGRTMPALPTSTAPF